MTSLPRSYLYVPGNAADKLARASERGAEALIIDLEDAVPLAEKERALDDVAAFLAGQRAGAPVELWVRVNPGERGLDDVRRLAGCAALTGFALAKADAPSVAAVAALLDDLEDPARLMPLIETPAAVLDAVAVASAPRVLRLQVGEVDLTGEAGITPGPDELEMLAIRTTIVLASAAASIVPPLGPVSRIVADLDAFEASTRHVARLGYLGRACIHPAQVPIVHRVFTPSELEVEQARETLRLLADAEARGSGVALDAQGRMIDPAVVASAQRVLDLHERASGMAVA